MKENDMLSTYYNDTNNKKYRSTCFTVIAISHLDSFVLDSDFDKKKDLLCIDIYKRGPLILVQTH